MTHYLLYLGQQIQNKYSQRKIQLHSQKQSRDSLKQKTQLMKFNETNNFHNLMLFFIIPFIYTVQVNLKLYRNYTQIKQFIGNLSQENLHVQQCPQDTNIFGVVLTNPQQNKNKIHVLINCGIHARQLITVQMCLNLINSILQDNELLKNNQITVIPDLNYKSRQKVLKGETWIRQNQNNVDLNRNFPADWKYQNHNNQTYPGPKPLSQVQSQCLDYFLRLKQYDMFLDIHSGQFTIYQEGTFNEKEKKIRNYFLYKCLQCRYQRDVDFNGITTKYAKSLGIQIDFTLQIYGGYNYKHKDQLFYMFNPNHRDILEYYMQFWTDTIIGGIKLL